MTPTDLAAQLRQPQGDAAADVLAGMSHSNQTLYERVLAAMPLQPGDRVLEIGAGNGRFTEALLAKADGLLYEGVDFSEASVAAAQQVNQALIDSGRATFRLGNSSDLPFADGSFNVAFCVNVLYFWEQPGQDLAELRRVLRSGGHLLIGIRSRDTMQRLPFTAHGFRLYSADELRALMVAHGFTVVNMVAEPEPPFPFRGEPVVLESVVAVATTSG